MVEKINPRINTAIGLLMKMKIKIQMNTVFKQFNCLPKYVSRMVKEIQMYSATNKVKSECLASSQKFLGIWRTSQV